MNFFSSCKIFGASLLLTSTLFSPTKAMNPFEEMLEQEGKKCSTKSGYMKENRKDIDENIRFNELLKKYAQEQRSRRILASRYGE